MTFCFCTLQNLNGRIVNQNGEHIGEWTSSLPAFASDIRNTGHGKGSPTNSNRNSAASSDSGRGYSTGHLDHTNANVKVSTGSKQIHQLLLSEQQHNWSALPTLGDLRRFIYQKCLSEKSECW